MTEAETAWRQRMFSELVNNKRATPEQALVHIEQQAVWRPWEPITDRFPILKNLARYSR